ncbi:MAG: hypothetical protein WKG00_37975 [Polyangiaceae bacterium]
MPASVPARGPLGDAHNFGRRVRLGDGRVAKPRTLLWEWLLLCARSPLRRRLDELGAREGLGRELFAFLPDLAFSAPHARAGGEVERVQLAPLSARSAKSRRALAEIVGRALALFSWLGLSDLHWENLVLGVDAGGRVIFAPLDVEMILADLSLPTQTKLLPDADPEVADICRHACGVRRALPWLGKPVPAELLLAMAGAYRGTLEILDRHAPAIAEVFAALPALRETPIRVLLRGTDAYVHAARAPPWPPLLDAEAEQLARGDVPYFFRLYGRAGIHYYANEALTRALRLPMRGDVPQLEPLLRVSRDLRSPSRKRLREDGLFTVLGAFDHRSLHGHQASESLAVTFAARTLKVTLSDGEELETRRDTSAFVGSVYLPCRCGEVRTVFVPAVTTCNARPARR